VFVIFLIFSFNFLASPLLHLKYAEILYYSRRMESYHEYLAQQLRKYPDYYDLWNLFVETTLAESFLSLSDPVNSSSSLRNNPDVVDLVDLGLSLFPRHPGLLYIRSLIYSSTSNILCEWEYLSAASLYPEHASGQMRNHFELNTLSKRVQLLRNNALQQFSISLPPFLNRSSLTAFQCPPFNHVYANTHFTDSSSPLSDRNALSMPWLAREHVLLHIGCSQVRRCPKSGWIVVDAIPSISTHFLLSATDLWLFPTGSVHTVYSSHTLEHLSHSNPCEVCRALVEWRRVLRPGGVSARVSYGCKDGTQLPPIWHRQHTLPPPSPSLFLALYLLVSVTVTLPAESQTLYLAVPDLLAIARLMTKPGLGADSKRTLQAMLFGGQGDPLDYHKTGFFLEYLTELLQDAGYCNVTRVERFGIFDDNSEALHEVRRTYGH